MRTANLALCALSALVALSCEGRSPIHAGKAPALTPKGDANLAVVDLAAGAPEVDAHGVFPLAMHRNSFAEAILEIDALRDDAEVKGAFVRFGSAHFGLGRALELGAALRRTADAGKAVHCHAEAFNNASLGNRCERVHAHHDRAIRCGRCERHCSRDSVLPKVSRR